MMRIPKNHLTAKDIFHSTAEPKKKKETVIQFPRRKSAPETLTAEQQAWADEYSQAEGRYWDADGNFNQPTKGK